MHRSIFKTTLLVAAISASNLASAMGLGAAQVKSSLGQPLSVVIPVFSDHAEELADNCFALSQSNQSDDSLPSLKKARLVLKNPAGVPYLLLTTPTVVNDPVLFFAIETRCSSMVRREYTALLDVANSAGPAVSAPAVTDKPSSVPTPVKSVPAEKHTHVSRHHASRVRQAVAVPQSVQDVEQPEYNMALRMSSGLTWLPGQHPLSAEQVTKLKRMRGMLSIDAGGQPAEVDKLRDDIVATQQQLAQAKQALTLLRAELVKNSTNQQQPAPPQTAVKHVTSWWQSAWLWSGLALMVLVVGYVLDRRRRLPDLTFADAYAGTEEQEKMQLGAITEVDSATNDLWAPAASDEFPAAKQQHPDIEFSVDKLPGHNLLTQATVQNTPVHAEALSVSNLMRVTEEAEVFLGLGYPDRAIAVLTEDIAATLRNHPAVWFMLLGIYREQGDRESFDQTVAGFRQRFNLIPPTWDSILHPEQEGEGILAMPHIQAKIVSLWPSHECHDFLSELLYDDRQGSRQGFSLDVYRDILWLKEILDVLGKPETTIAEQVAAEDNLDWDFH
ncbi:type IV pilus assembly protein FimV [Sulfuriferula thiophila]|uniref:type IV pilus assembly protein FimV n=1 Tax=Sulfuriferula thiophila TaxID=1781211 RepID=UPI000F611820|nr:hypothetical protein [Sulfuriferula thiophila]